jgi:hypothetical protein
MVPIATVPTHRPKALTAASIIYKDSLSANECRGFVQKMKSWGSMMDLKNTRGVFNKRQCSFGSVAIARAYNKREYDRMKSLSFG